MKDTKDKITLLSAATTYILLALASGDLHGYGIILEIARQSDGGYRPGPGTLYDNLKKLMDQGLVVDAPPAEGEERRLYRLTDAGRAALSSEVERLADVVTAARARLDGRRAQGI